MMTRDCLKAAAPDDDAKSDSADEPAQIRDVVCPEVGIKGMAQVFRDVRRVVLHAETLQKVATDSGSQSAQGHNDQELEQLRKEIVSRDSRARARSCRDGERYSEKETYPPGCENSPTESQKRRRLGVEYVGMKDREILKTD